MIYTCPKCGKKMELSTEVLINNDYKVICPQCLCQLQIIGDYAYVPQESLELDTTVERSRTINCPKCGHEASTGAHFCPTCGTSFDTPARDVEAEDVTVLPPPVPNCDPLYNEAVQFLRGCTAITPMMLRDRFHITDERAAELIRQLEAGGVIGPYNNGGPRQILIPHRSIYISTPTTDMRRGRIPNMGTPQPHRSGCIPTLVITIIIMFIVWTCTG